MIFKISKSVCFKLAIEGILLIDLNLQNNITFSQYFLKQLPRKFLTHVGRSLHIAKIYIGMIRYRAHAGFKELI